MLRNRRKNARKRNTRNAKNRNGTKSTNVDEDSIITSDSCWDSMSSLSDLDFDDSEVSSEEESSEHTPVVSKKRPTRTKRRVNPKSKPRAKSNGVGKKSNRNRNDPDVAGPSSASNSSNSNRGPNGNTGKRKCKEKTRTLDSEESSSDDLFSHTVQRSRAKRLRRSDVDSDDSDSSTIFCLTTRRTGFIQSESSDTSSEGIIRPVPRRRRDASSSILTWSDSDSSVVHNTIVPNDSSTSSTLGELIPEERQSSESDTVNNFSSVRVAPIPSSSGSSSSSSISSLFSDSSTSAGSLFSSSSTFNSLFSVDSDSLMASNESSAVDTTKSYVSARDQVISSDSDSNDPEGEKCAICLKKFRKQRVGNPSNCEHNFCVTCLQEWSKSSNTCPVDRSIFETIIVRNEVGGNIVERIEVQSRNFAVFPPVDAEEVLLNDTITCERCGSGEDEETLLLCDLCNLGYHMACLDPPLQAIPAGSWYCPPCRLLHRNPSQNMNEAMRRLIDNLPLPPLVLSSSSTRQNRSQPRTGRVRLFGPPQRGRGPTLSHRQRNNNATDSTTNVIESTLESRLENIRTSLTHNRRKKRNRRNRRRRCNQLNTNVAAQMSRNLAEIASSKDRISRRLDETLLSSTNTRVAARPSEVVDMVFPSFTLFGNDDLNYFSDEVNEDDGLEGEVAIMARVRSEYSARRIENRKNMVSNLVNGYPSRNRAAIDQSITEDVASSSNILDSILESQTLWHSKNVEISSKKDGTFEIKLKKEGGKKPDLSDTKHSSKEIPLYPNKNENSSSEHNKSYSGNTRYSNFGGGSSGSSHAFGQSTSSFNSLNPSTRPGFSNILGNSSPALDLSPFRGTTPIRFRMNPPRSALRRANYNNSNSVRHSSNNASMLNSQSPRKSSSSAAAGGGDDDVDLYDDIESDNAETDKMPEMFSSLEPPPEPPALLIGSDSSSDEDNGLVIDDKASSANKSNIYDPTEPNEDSDVESNQDKNTNIVPGYLRSPSYGGISEFGPHLPLPEPPAPPIELESVNNSDSEEEAECPNMTLYSSTSMNLANNSVQDIPVPDSSYPTMGPEFLDFIPIPTAAPSDEIPLPEEKEKSPPKPPIPASELYSPTAKDDSDSSSSDVEEIVSDKSSPHSEKAADRRCSSGSSSSEEDEFSSEDEKKKPPSRKPSKSATPEKEPPADESSLDVEIIKSDSEKSDAGKSDFEKSDDEKSEADKSDSGKSDTEEVREVSVEKPEDKDVESVTEVEKTTKEIEKCAVDDTVADEDDAAKIDDAVPDKAKDDEEKDDEEKDDDKASVDDKVEDVAIASKKDDKDEDAADEAQTSDKIETQVIEDEDDEEGLKEEEVPAEVEATASRKTSVEKVNDDDDVNETDEGPKDDDSSEVAKANSGDLNASNAYLLPSEDLDPVSDVEYNDFPEYQKQSSNKERRKKRKKARKRDSSAEPATKPENRELEEGEIEEDRTKKKHTAPRKRRTSDSEERLSDKKPKRRRDRKDKSTGKENKDASSRNEADLTWKKLSKSTKERNYRDGKLKPDKLVDRNREREATKKKEKRKEIERYDVRKIVSEKPRTMRDEFGRDISVPRTRSRSLSPARSYSSRRRSKGPLRRSFSQDDRWIDWSPVWTQRRSRSRTRRSCSRSRNRSRHSGDRYRNRSKGRNREHDKRESRKRKRSLSSLDRYSSEDRKRKRSKERAHRAGSYNTRVSREVPEYFYERSWSRSPSYASLSPQPNTYVSRYERSPSIIEPARIPVVSPEPGLLSPNPTLTVIVPNDVSKKKHKKKKDGKKKKKKQPSKEVFTSGDNIVVSVNFDDNQKIISAKSSKRKHDEEKSRKKKKEGKKRKQALQVSEEVLNAKPVAVIDLNTSPCKEMSPTEVISLTDSGDENTANDIAVPVDRRTQEYNEGYQTTENANKSPERRAYVMTSSGPKTPPEPSIKFTVTSNASIRPLPTNPIFEQDEELEREDDSVHYNKGPNTPPEPSNQTPNATMYDPFEPTKSRSQTPERTEIYKEHQDSVVDGRTTIDMFADDGEKPSDSQSAEKPKSQEDNKDSSATATTSEETSVPRPSPAKEVATSEASGESTQTNGLNTLVLDLSSLGDEFVPKSSIPLIKTSQGKYEFQGGKSTPDKPITVVISQQTTPAKPLPQQVMVTPTRQIPTKPVEPIKQPMFPDILPWKLPPPLSQATFATPPPAISTVTPTTLITPSKSAPGVLTQNGSQDDSFDLDDSPYSPASSEGDDLFEPPPLNATGNAPSSRGAPLPTVNSYKSRVDALFSSSSVKKLPPRPVSHPKPISAIKGSKKVTKAGVGGKKEVGIKADEEQLKILDDVPNSAVEMIVKEKFLKKLHRQERVVEEVKVVLKPHYAKKHLTKEEYKDILRRAVPKICHNKSGDINPSKIQSLVEAYVRKIRHSKKKGPTIPSSTAPPMFPSVTTGKQMKNTDGSKTENWVSSLPSQQTLLRGQWRIQKGSARNTLFSVRK